MALEYVILTLIALNGSSAVDQERRAQPFQPARLHRSSSRGRRGGALFCLVTMSQMGVRFGM